MPEGFDLARPAQPPSPRAAGPRGQLDLSVPPRLLEGRATPEGQIVVRGAPVGPNWNNAFRRWLDENLHYPLDAAMRGESGVVRVRITARPDGTVIGLRMLQPSASPSLNTGTIRPFIGARLPAFPPGADPNGVEIDLTVHYILLRRR
ncbi:MAG: energy transducer TonB [Rhodovarius sp.]|nr:energy transducer TonB [Rhodovarius sp.]MDW8313945.1 energy transducer TonB [Rhodovarius sp.]